MSKEKKSLEDQNVETRERLMKAAEKIEETEAEDDIKHERITFDEICDVRYTRERVLKGTEFREKVGLPELGDGAFLIIRPLTDAEFIEVQNIILGDATMSVFSHPEAKVTDMITRKQRGEYLALSYALSFDDEEWMPEDIGQLPTGVPDKLYERLALISGFPRPPMPEPSEEEAE